MPGVYIDPTNINSCHLTHAPQFSSTFLQASPTGPQVATTFSPSVALSGSSTASTRTHSMRSFSLHLSLLKLIPKKNSDCPISPQVLHCKFFHPWGQACRLGVSLSGHTLSMTRACHFRRHLCIIGTNITSEQQTPLILIKPIKSSIMVSTIKKNIYFLMDRGFNANVNRA